MIHKFMNFISNILVEHETFKDTFYKNVYVIKY